jgi:SAM-dependent methyltransferase
VWGRLSFSLVPLSTVLSVVDNADNPLAARVHVEQMEISQIMNRLWRLHERFHDARLNIRTCEWHQSIDSTRPEFRGYAPTSYRDWFVLRRFIKTGGYFIDYGAGLGRVTVLAARLPFDDVIGVEIDRDLAARGNKNLRKARRLRSPVRIICADAASFEVPSQTATIFCNNPFSGSVLTAVLGRARHARPRIICDLPGDSSFGREITAVPWLRLQNRIALQYGRLGLVFDH